MEPRDLIGSVRSKEVDSERGRAELNQEDPEAIGLAQGDDVIDHIIGERWATSGEGEGLEEQGEGLEEQGEGLEEQEFSIKEASFQEGSLKLKIQTTKRTKKPPKSLENYICPPEIRLTGERGPRGGRGGRLGHEEERGPPRKRTYERLFRAMEQREGGMLQLLGDHTPAKHTHTQAYTHTQLQHTHTQLQHTHTQLQHTNLLSLSQTNLPPPNWDMFSALPANHMACPVEQPATNRSSLIDTTPPYSQGGSGSPSPLRSMTPDPQLPVVTDASILNLTSLSRGSGLQEVSEQLFGNIKRKYVRKDSQRVLGNTHNAELWVKQIERGGEGMQEAEEKQRVRREEPHLLLEEREERSIMGRRGEEEDVPMVTEESKGRKKRIRKVIQGSCSLEDQSEQFLDVDLPDKRPQGPPDPKVAAKMVARKRECGIMKRSEQHADRTGRGENSERTDRRETKRVEPVVSQSKKNFAVRPRTSYEPNPVLPCPNPTLPSSNPVLPSPNPTLPSSNPTLPSSNPVLPSPNPTLLSSNPTLPSSNPTLASSNPTPLCPNPVLPSYNPTLPSPNPTLPSPNPTLPSPSPSASLSPRPRSNLSPRFRPSFSPSPKTNLSLSPGPSPNLSPRPRHNLSPSPSPKPRPNLSPRENPYLSPSPAPNLTTSPNLRPNLSPSPKPRPNLSPSPRLRPNHSLSPNPRPNHSTSPIPGPNLSLSPNPTPIPSPRSRPNLCPSPRPKPRPNLSSSPRPNISLSPNPRPNLILSASPRATLNPASRPSPSPIPTLKPTKAKDRWSYLRARSPPSLSPQDSIAPPSTLSDPPSAFPITPSSPLYTNTDSLTVHPPPKRKRGRPKKQPLLTVETIHEGTATCPPSPPHCHFNTGPGRGQKTHSLTSLAQMPSCPASANTSGLLLPRGRGSHARQVKRLKLGKMQSILNEILSGSAQNGNLVLKSSSSPVTSAMTAVASSIEARLGKQINVSKRGTIYIGKKRGRKPRAQAQDNPPRASLYDNLVVPSTPPISSRPPSFRPGLYEASMPSLQPVSALPSKPSSRGALLGWKLSPPRLLAHSPSHLAEGTSAKEVTLSPISESHSEETIPSDSGIGTDNNSTSDQTEKGPASRRRYSFDLCGLDAAEAAVLEASSRATRGRCDRQAAAEDSFLSQHEKKQKHHRRKRKCLQSRDHLHFLSELEEVILKVQQLRVSHRRSGCYSQQSYPSVFHHYYPLTFHPYACDSTPYLRRSAQLKVKRRRGRPAKISQPIPAKLPLVQGYGFPLGGGNYYAAPYALPYPPPLSLGYYSPHAPPLYLPPHPLGPVPPSPFIRPAGPPPKAFLPGGHAQIQAGAKMRVSSTPLQGVSGRAGEARGSLGAGGGGGGSRAVGLGGVRLHKRKHKHKHKHKEEPLLSARDRKELGGIFSGTLLSDRREIANQSSSVFVEKQRGVSRSERALSLTEAHFHSHQLGQPMSSFLTNYRGQSQRASELFSDSHQETVSGRSQRRGLAVFGEEGMMSFKNARKAEAPMSDCSPLTGKRRYKRREVEEIQKEVRRSFDHVQKILRVKRLQRQAKTGNNVVKRPPGRPRKRPLEESEPQMEDRRDGRSLGMPVLERCVDLPGRRSSRPSPAPQPLEFSNHDSISAAIETVVHRARSVASPLASGGKRRGRRREELWSPTSQ